jgi:hypothetical protein
MDKRGKENSRAVHHNIAFSIASNLLELATPRLAATEKVATSLERLQQALELRGGGAVCVGTRMRWQ